jgi:hypothetical protein
VAAVVLLAAGPSLATDPPSKPATVTGAAHDTGGKGVAAVLPPVKLRYDPTPSSFRVPPPAEFLRMEKGLAVPKASLAIVYLPAGSVQGEATCTTWPENAKGAFTYAANVWASLLQSTVPIAIEACWANNLGENVLGQAGPATFYKNFTGAPVTDTWYPIALMNALRGSDQEPGQPDIQAAFSSTFDWYFGTDGSPGARVDFASVVLHEIGHGLGFLGFMKVAEGLGSWGLGSGSPAAWDRFTENGAGQSLINTAIFPNPSTALATQLQSGSVFFDGPNANAANGGTRVPLYAPNPWQDGSSYSHLAESFNGTPNALMTFALPAGEAIHDPGPVTLGMLEDMGWSLLGASATLTVSVTGNGVVNSFPSGISCAPTCSASFPLNTVVTLTALPATGSVFSGWSGACTGTGSCVVTMSAARSVAATFVPTPPAAFTLTVTKSGAGSGTVTSSPPGIDCGTACAFDFANGQALTLTATASPGSVFSGWSGACTGTGTCAVTMDAARSVTATFNPAPPPMYTLGVTKVGTGSGLVTSLPAGISCGTACAFDFASGQSVTLTAAAATGSVFTGWSGGGCSGIGACTVTISAATTVTATFVTQAGTPALTLVPASLDFGGQSMGTTSPAQSVAVINVGNGLVTVSGVSTTDPQFAQAHDCTTIAVGAACTVSVTYSPAIAPVPLLGTASAAGSVVIASNAASSPHTVALSGTGEKSLVTHYYRSILRRAPDDGGKAYWSGEAARVQALGLDVNEAWFALAATFYTSAEYLAFGRDDAGFVTDLYNTFFNRGPDAGGLAFWTGQLAGGMPREVVLVEFMFSAEFRNFTQGIFGTTAVRAEVDTVTDFYRGLLARLPDSGGFGFWVQQFRTAQCAGSAAVNTQVESISSLFALSAEYAARNRSNAQYVGDLYNAFLRRGGDLAGVLFWINEISTGARTRESVRQAFVASPEFQARVAAIINQGCLP